MVKHHHAVMHNHNVQAYVAANEMPLPGERGMISPIRVRGRTTSDRLHAMARINFSRTYTVEHNVKVYDFGDVYKNDLPDLHNQWRSVVNSNIDSAWQHAIRTVPEEGEEEDENQERRVEEENDDDLYE